METMARFEVEAIGLNDDEVAFYDALGTNDSAVAVLGDEQLRSIARQLGPCRLCIAARTSAVP
jgi:hypothetical protein